MTRSLLDANVLLALLDSDHVDHAAATAWLDEHIDDGWASCPITQNGFVPIISQPRYPSPISPAHAVALLGRACQGSGHQLWSCDLSLLDPAVVDATRLHSPRQVTNAYLLALAVARDGRVVTFDRGMPLLAVRGAGERHVVVL